MKQPYFYEKNGLLYTKSGLNFHFQPTYLSDICFFTVLLLNLWEKFPHLALPVHPSPAGFPVPVSFQKSQETSVFLSLTHPEIFFFLCRRIVSLFCAITLRTITTGIKTANNIAESTSEIPTFVPGI